MVLLSITIYVINRIVTAIAKPVESCSRRVLRNEPSARRLVVASPHVDDPRLIVLLVADVCAIAALRISARRTVTYKAPGIVATLVTKGIIICPSSEKAGGHIAMSIINREAH